MKFAQKAFVATIGVLAAILLAGCAAGPNTATDDAPKTSDAPTAQTQPENRKVNVVEIIDPLTIKVTPIKDTDALFGEEFTVHLNDFLTVTVGECGYDETLALATKTLTDRPWILDYRGVKDNVWIDDKGDHHGALDTNGTPYGLTMVSEGFGYLPISDERSWLATPQDEAKRAGAGLWSSCPDFGTDR